MEISNFDKAKIDYLPSFVLGIDPGAKETGMVVINSKGEIATNSTIYTPSGATLFLKNLAKYAKNKGLIIFERPFAATNMLTYGQTWQAIGYIRAMANFMFTENPPEVMFITPREGNVALGLDGASTTNTAKMNVSYANKWGLLSAHEVSAYAVILAAYKKGVYKINDETVLNTDNTDIPVISAISS